MYTRYAYANTRTKRFFFFSFSLSGILLKRRNSAIKSSLEWSSRAPLGSLAKTKVGSSRLCSRAKSLLYSHRDAYKRPVVNVSHAVIISGEKKPFLLATEIDDPLASASCIQPRHFPHKLGYLRQLMCTQCVHYRRIVYRRPIMNQ